MAPTQCNGVPLMRTGPDSGDKRAGKRAHGAPGRDATTRSEEGLAVTGETPSIVALVDKGPRSTNWSKKKEEYIRNFIRKAKEKQGKEKKINATKFTQEQKRKWILETFGLAQKPCLAKRRTWRRPQTYSLSTGTPSHYDGSYGHTHLIQHRIITEDMPPIKCWYRPINPALEPALREQLNEWLRHDIIEPADSPWSFNLVAAKKKGGKIRWCIDWR